MQLRFEPLVEARVAGAHLAHGIHVAGPRAKGESVQSVKNARIPLDLSGYVVRSMLLGSWRRLV
jgi:hypothetical protein